MDASEPHPPHGPRSLDLVDGLLLGGLLTAWAAWAWRLWFLCDDAFISFRYARNWGEGLGLRYNTGDHVPVEGFSNFLLVAWGALTHALGLDLTTTVPALTFVAAGTLVAALYTRVRVGLGLGRLEATVAGAFVGLSAMGGVWSTSGLETMLYTLLLYGTADQLLLATEGDEGTPAPVRAGLLGLLTTLTRVEGVYWMAVIAGLFALSARLRGRSLRPLGPFVAIVGLGYGAFFAWKLSWFGMALSATTHAKVHFSGARLVRGLEYVAVQVLTSPALLAVVPGTVAALRSPRWRVHLPIALLAWGFPTLAIAVSGDFMAFGRFLVPMLPFTAVILAWHLHRLRATLPVLVVAQLGAAWVVAGHLPGWNIHLVPEDVRRALHFRDNRDDDHFRSELEQWHRQRRSAEKWTIRGRCLDLVSGPDDAVVMAAIGAAGFHAPDLFVYDQHGFVTREVATRPIPEETLDDLQSPGHDHPAEVTFFLDLEPTPTILLTKLRPVGRRRVFQAWLTTVVQDLQAQGLTDDYVPAFWHVVGGGSQHGLTGRTRRMFVVVRRIPEGTSRKAAWQAFAAQRMAFLDDGVAPILDLDAGRIGPPGLPPEPDRGAPTASDDDGEDTDRP